MAFTYRVNRVSTVLVLFKSTNYCFLKRIKKLPANYRFIGAKRHLVGAKRLLDGATRLRVGVKRFGVKRTWGETNVIRQMDMERLEGRAAA